MRNPIHSVRFPKLDTRVRFPSPAQTPKPQVRDLLPACGFRFAWPRSGRRAIGVRLGPLVSPEPSVRSVLLNQGVEPVCESAGPSLGGVLVDQCSPHRRVPHAMHQLSRRGTRLGHEVVAGVAQVVEVEATRKAGRCVRLLPTDVAAPVASARCGPTFAGEDKGFGPIRHTFQVLEGRRCDTSAQESAPRGHLEPRRGVPLPFGRGPPTGPSRRS